MCVRSYGRDERGRLLPGHSGNLAGRPTRKPYLRLLEAAEACGAELVVLVPTRARVAAVVDDTNPAPPAAA
jgi:hypothetical protein